jgi:glycerate-2-kinase
MTPPNPHLAVPTLRAADEAGNTLEVDVNVDVNQLLLIESGGGDSLLAVPLPNVPLSDLQLMHVALSKGGPDGSVVKE